MLPFASKHRRAFVEPLPKPDMPRVVVTQCVESHCGHSQLARLETKIRAIEMIPERRVESKWRVAADDQQQLVKCSYACRQR